VSTLVGEKSRGASSADDGDLGVQILTLSLKKLPLTGILLERIGTGIRWWSRLKGRLEGTLGAFSGVE
jgi:hypothetical protein